MEGLCLFKLYQRDKNVNPSHETDFYLLLEDNIAMQLELDKYVRKYCNFLELFIVKKLQNSSIIQIVWVLPSSVRDDIILIAYRLKIPGSTQLQSPNLLSKTHFKSNNDFTVI